MNGQRIDDLIFAAIILLVASAIGWFLPSVGDPRIGYLVGLLVGALLTIAIDTRYER